MSWLKLEVQRFSDGPDLPRPKRNLKVIVPKRILKLATARNRLRRLIKEAIRLGCGMEKDSFYTLRVLKNPGDIGLSQVQEVLYAQWPK